MSVLAAQPGRHNPKRELWLSWSTLVVFYNFFFLVFFLI